MNLKILLKVSVVKCVSLTPFLVAEFGGTVDLLIGISFFTVFQLFEIALAWFLMKFMSKKGAREANDEQEGSKEIMNPDNS